MTAIRLPSAPRSSLARIETGTSARSSRPSVRTPRERSQRASAPATTVSTTSLTVPPSAFLIALKSSSWPRTTAIRRWEPISTLSGVGGAGSKPAPTPSLTPSTAPRTAPTAASGLVMPRSARTASPAVWPTRPRTPPRASSAPEGSLCGCHSPPSGSIGWGTGERSNSTVARSTPATPSIRAWWVLVISAKRLSASPSTNQVSHSGLERSSRWEKIRAASASSFGSSPGSGSAVWRTWYSRLKDGSSTHSGRPVSSRGAAPALAATGNAPQYACRTLPGPDEIGEELEAGAARHFGRPVEIEGLEPLQGGASRELWAFAAVLDGRHRELVLRRDPEGVEDPPARRRELEALAAAQRHGVPVPEPLWLHG